MPKQIKAIFTNGTLTPLEPVELKEGEEVTLSIGNTLSPERSHKQRRYRNSRVDKVPQPKGEFRNLFQEMQERSEAKRKRTAKIEKSA